jgi:conjugative transfer signal peptidase TraF
MPGRWHKFAVIAPATLTCLFIVCATAGLRINTTGSLPVGLYIKTARPTDLVEFCPAEPFASLAISRGYRGRGSCRDGAMPLVKPVVAQAGDVVDFSARGIAVNGRSLDNTAPQAADSAGRALQPWHFGNYKVASGTVLVASSYNPKSFDSRYFGPVPVSAIRARLRSLFTFSDR